jgi:hypothetical protein
LDPHIFYVRTKLLWTGPQSNCDFYKPNHGRLHWSALAWSLDPLALLLYILFWKDRMRSRLIIIPIQLFYLFIAMMVPNLLVVPS